MQQYLGVKIIKAEPMNLGDYNIKRGWTIPANEDPNKEGYLVQYEDNYISWSPKEMFENAYRKTTALTFGLAIEALKLGKKVSRSGWNGKGMFVYLVPANSYPSQTGAAKSYFGENSMVKYNAYMALKKVDDTVSTWVASVNETLAEDWQIID